MATKHPRFKTTADSDDEFADLDRDAAEQDESEGGGNTLVQAPTIAAPKRNYTLKEAAVYLNVSTRTVERLIERKLIRRNKALRKILIPRFELDAFLKKTL